VITSCLFFNCRYSYPLKIAVVEPARPCLASNRSVAQLDLGQYGPGRRHFQAWDVVAEFSPRKHTKLRSAAQRRVLHHYGGLALVWRASPSGMVWRPGFVFCGRPMR